MVDYILFWLFVLSSSDLISSIESFVNIWAALIGGFQACFTIIALTVGGIWSYLLFVRTRQKYPRAVLEHSVTSVDLDSDRKLLHLDLSIHNVGEIKISVSSWKVWVQQVLPYKVPEDWIEEFKEQKEISGSGTTQIEWPLVGENENTRVRGKEIEIESKEIHHMNFDFLIDPDIEMVFVYSYIRNVAISDRPELGWTLKSLVNVNRGPTVEERNE